MPPRWRPTASTRCSTARRTSSDFSACGSPRDRPNEDHPCGHGKYETFAASLIGILLIFAGHTVGRGVVDSLLGRGLPTEVTTISFLIMLGTLSVNILVATWERRAGRRLGSEVLVADASHTLSDVLVSVGVIVSLVVVRLG